MTLLETCRRYNVLVKRMFQAAEAGQWDQAIALNQECAPYIERLVNQSSEDFEQEADDKVRFLIGEIVSYYADISALGRTHRDEIKADLSLASTSSKLDKLYGV